MLSFQSLQTTGRWLLIEMKVIANLKKDYGRRSSIQSSKKTARISSASQGPGVMRCSTTDGYEHGSLDRDLVELLSRVFCQTLEGIF
jgi:hypothetical protein